MKASTTNSERSKHEDTAKRMSRLLPKANDPRWILLVGHLLIEEHLTRFLEEASMNPEFVSRARLRFPQLANLVKALSPKGFVDTTELCLSARDSPSQIWTFIDGLNRLRNKIAHKAEDPDLGKKIDQLLKDYHKGDYPSKPTNRDRASCLRFALAVTAGYLEGGAAVLRL